MVFVFTASKPSQIRSMRVISPEPCSAPSASRCSTRRGKIVFDFTGPRITSSAVCFARAAMISRIIVNLIRRKRARTLRFLHLISHAVDGEDVLRFGGFGFELLAQVVDVAIERTLEDRTVVVELVEELTTGEDLAGMLGKHGEDTELRRGERRRTAAHANLVGAKIDIEVADADE